MGCGGGGGGATASNGIEVSQCGGLDIWTRVIWCLYAPGLMFATKLSLPYQHNPASGPSGKNCGRHLHRHLYNGAAGLLDNRRCTIHWENIDGSEVFKLDITNDLLEIDGNRLTCSRNCRAGHDAKFNHRRLWSSLASEISDQFIHDRIQNRPTGSVWSYEAGSVLATPNYWPWSKSWKRIWKTHAQIELAEITFIDAQLERLFRNI